jgi:ankyrin repeat protein
MAEGSGRRSDYFRRHPVATTIAGACAAVALIIAAVLAVGVVGLLLGLRSLGRAGSSDPCDTADLKVVHLAARAEVHALDTWLDRHPRDVDRIDPNGTSALSCAAQRGRLPTVRVLLQHDLDPRSPVAGRALVLAIQHDRAPVTEALLAGVDLSAPYAPSPQYRVADAALVFAAQEGDGDLTKTLLGHDADPNRSPFASPLLRAIVLGHDGVAATLLAARADPDAGRVDPLIVVVATDEHPPPPELIVELPSEFTSRIRSTAPMDHRRAPTIRSDGARLGSDTLGTFNDQLEPFDPNRTVDAPPLAVAAAYQDAGLVRLLLTGGADPNRLALDGRSPIELAAMACDPKIVRMLAERGARVDASRHDVRAEACATVRPLLPAR